MELKHKQTFAFFFLLVSAGCLFLLLQPLQAAETTSSEAEYTFGVFPFLTQDTLEKTFAPITKELSDAIGRPITFQTTTTFEEFQTSLAQQKFDIAHIQPFDYVKIAIPAGYLPLAVRSEPLSAVFIVRQESLIKNPLDLKGKTIGLPPKVAAVSYLALATLLKMDLKPGKDVTVLHFPNHQACLHQLVIGATDVCASGYPVIRVFEQKTQLPMRIVLRSAQIPHTLFVAHQRVPAVIREKLKHTLIETELPGVAPEYLIFFKKSSVGPGKYFRPVQDGDYDIISDYIKLIYQDAAQ